MADLPAAGGYGLEEDGHIVGSLRDFDPGAVLGGHFAAYLARTPLSLALLVEAAGPTAQKHVGRILLARVLGENDRIRRPGLRVGRSRLRVGPLRPREGAVPFRQGRSAPREIS